MEIPPRPGEQRTDADAARVMQDSYRLDHAEFETACAEWTSYEGAFSGHIPPSAWSAYRSLQGSGFFGPAVDPNPFRHALDFVRELEQRLIREWLLAKEPHTWDLERVVVDGLRTRGLQCAEPRDLPYLGFLLATQTRVEPFQPLVHQSLERHLASQATTVELHPPDESVRIHLEGARPVVLHDWLSTARPAGPAANLRSELATNPLRFAFR